MENIIPMNGRIAIVDDKIKQALPLMRVFSRNNIPYTYYDGSDYACFPDEPENDIRILFLDLNLLGEKTQKDAEIKSSLIGILRRILSPNNYPYILILWSRQEKEYKSVVESIFDKELADRAPIAIESYIKSDFFPNFAEEIDESKDIQKLFDELKRIFAKHLAYCCLMQWENIVHESTDDLLKRIYPNAKPADWETTTNAILMSLGQAYLGKHFNDASLEEKIKASLFALNMVFVDSIDNKTTSASFNTQGGIDDSEFDETRIEEVKAELNFKLNFFESPNSIDEPGVVFLCTNPKTNYFEDILNKVLSLFFIRQQIKLNDPEILDSLLKQEVRKKMHDIKDEIKESWKKIGIVVTPSCDFAQKKKIYDRIIQGIIIESRFEKYINTGDAFYTSPVFRYEGKNYIIVLNFNYFITLDLLNDGDNQLICKMRHPMLSEIQSKLARHVNRQGILSL